MNLAIWKKAVSDAWLPLALSSVILILFSWLFVWLMSQMEVGAIGAILRIMPDFLKKAMRIPLEDLATPTGQLSMLYVHVITLLVCVGWAVGRGSDSISGEIGRGTADLLLSLPVWRATVMAVPAVVATLGGAVLAASVLAGISLGLWTVSLPGNISSWAFLPGTINLFFMIFCLTGVTTFVSSWNRDRWRTIGLSGGFFVVSLILKIAWRLWSEGDWLKYFTFLGGFRPQRLILDPEGTGTLAVYCNLVLLGLGLVAYVAAAIVLTYRDIPSAR